MLSYDLAIIGFGVIGSEAIYSINKLKLKKKIKIAIIDKDKKNIPGGVAYSINKSKYGFFNNPLRLSHPSFINWISRTEKFNQCCNFLSSNPSYNLNNWLKKISTNNFLEIYLPRLFYSFYLEEKILSVIKNKNSSLKIDFFDGNVDQLICKKKNTIFSNSYFNKYTFKKKTKKIHLVKKKIKTKKIEVKKIILGIGLPPPKKIQSNFNKTNNYIWDFYSEGGTQNLVNKLMRLKKLKKINLIFIGNKAGFLETMQKLENIIKLRKLNFKIYCIASKNETLQKAELSKNYLSYKFKFLINSEINKIKTPNKILSLIKNEFSHSKKKGFSKYDIWTLILKKKILTKCYKKLSFKGKKEYNSSIFTKIRNITRYTYPETVNSKERLEKLGKITFITDKVTFVKKNKNKFILITEKGKMLKGDLVNNVSGPVNIYEVTNESSLLNSLKNITNKYDESGFLTDKNFKLSKDIFSPGVISNNFNPARETIIKAITNNVYKVVKKLSKEI
jgi:hypothetical protein